MNYIQIYIIVFVRLELVVLCEVVDLCYLWC